MEEQVEIVQRATSLLTATEAVSRGINMAERTIAAVFEGAFSNAIGAAREL